MGVSLLLLVAVYACAAGAAVWHSVEGSYMAGYEAANNRQKNKNMEDNSKLVLEPLSIEDEQYIQGGFFVELCTIYGVVLAGAYALGYYNGVQDR